MVGPGTGPVVGVVGLGNMGGALAANLAGHGLETHGFDAAGAERVPDGVAAASSVADLARRADTIVLSLPDGGVSRRVADEIIAVDDRRIECVVDTSTVGVDAAQDIERLLDSAGIAHVDAPVSGGAAGARARTLMVMFSGDARACELAGPVLDGLSDRRRRVGDRSGLAQALKLANNFLSATALAATSEALAFGVSVGLDPATMIEVLNESSGQSAASRDKFPDHVLTGRYESGFLNTLMAKDVALYRDAADGEIAALTAAIWRRFADAEPGADFTRIAPFLDRHHP